MASLPSNKNSGLWAGKVTSSWRRGPSSLHGSLGSIWKPCWSAPSFFSSHHRSNAKWHESGGGVSKNAWLHLNAYATHEIAHTIAHNPSRECRATKKKPANQWWSRGWHALLGSQLFSKDFTLYPPPPPPPPHTQTHTHRWRTDVEVWTEGYLYQQVWHLRHRVAAKPQSEFKLGLILKVKGKSPASLRLWKSAERFQTDSLWHFDIYWFFIVSALCPSATRTGTSLGEDVIFGQWLN